MASTLEPGTLKLISGPEFNFQRRIFSGCVFLFELARLFPSGPNCVAGNLASFLGAQDAGARLSAFRAADFGEGFCMVAGFDFHRAQPIRLPCKKVNTN